MGNDSRIASSNVGTNGQRTVVKPSRWRTRVGMILSLLIAPAVYGETAYTAYHSRDGVIDFAGVFASGEDSCVSGFEVLKSMGRFQPPLTDPQFCVHYNPGSGLCTGGWREQNCTGFGRILETSTPTCTGAAVLVKPPGVYAEQTDRRPTLSRHTGTQRHLFL